MALTRQPVYSARGFITRGAITATSGILLIIFTSVLAELAVDVFLLYLAGRAVVELLMRLIWHKKASHSAWWNLTTAVGLGVLAWAAHFSLLPLYVVVIVIGLYEVLMSFVNGVTWAIYRDNRIRPRWRFLFSATWLGILGIGTLISPATNLTVQLVLLGGYLVLRGLTDVRDGVTFNREAEARHAGRRARISLPIVVAALIPRATLQHLNNLLIGDDPAERQQALMENYDQSKPGATPDLEVFIHVTESGFGAIGHVDLAYQGVVHSYGNYDPSSSKLFEMIGDGVLFKTDRERYIQFCITHSKKTLFGYGIALTDEQRVGVEEQLAQIQNHVQPWQPEPSEPRTYAQDLHASTDAELFKFLDGKFKTYFVLSTNCVLLADSVIGRAGTDILSVSGFIAPGTYQDYLNSEFEKPGSIVVTKTAYQ